MNHQKRILAINDISCFGKCSLTVAIPILSAAGLETCPLPTAVLSAHTAFSGFTFRDLTEDMLPQANHWHEMALSFQGIYSGYLGSIRQVAYVEKIVDMFPCDFVLVDPVMGDNGKLYAGFDESFAVEMKRLLSRADVAVPNVTEACCLSGVAYEDGIHSKDYLETILHKLTACTKGNLVITGVHTAKDTLGTAVFVNNQLSVIERQKCHVSYSGTGDVFASTLAAAILNGRSLADAAEMASDFVIDCIDATIRTSGDRNYGVNFELCMESLLQKLHPMKKS